MRKFFNYLIWILMAITVFGILQYLFSNPFSGNLRLQSTGFNDRFTYTGKDFAEYITQTKTLIKNARTKAGAPSSPEIIEENAPFQLNPDPKVCGENHNGHYQNGVLLVHGLGDSPYTMRALGRYFQSRCFLVRAILLPGMGTTAGDLTRVNYHQWLTAARYGINSFNGEVDNFYMTGFSLGGIVVLQTIPDAKNLRGVILFSPAFEINSAVDFLIQPLDVLSHVFPQLEWQSVYPENNPVKYNSFALNGIAQTHILGKKFMDEKNETDFQKVPLFVVASYVDKTIKAKTVLQKFAGNQNKLSRMILFKNSPYQTSDSRLQIFPDKYPSDNFLDLSHYAVIFSPQDPLFGLNGKLRDCLHYSIDSSDWGKCKTLPHNNKGEITEKNLQQGILQRSSYNPFWETVLSQLDTFLSNTKSH